MAAYCFEFDMETWKGVSGTRHYEDDRRARQAATRMFKARTSDANDELYIWRGRKTACGDVEGAKVGTLAFGPLGNAVVFIPHEPLSDDE